MPIFQRNRDKPTAAEAPARRIRVLAVDENPTALEVLGRRLSHAGHDVILANGAGVAMSQLMGEPA